MKKMISITVGICTRNEAGNIGQLVESVIKQEHTNFTMDKIIIISDGSTDNTGEVLKTIKHPLVEIIDSKVNRGLIARQNQIFRQAKSEVILCLDGDSIIKSTDVLDMMALPFSDMEVTLVSGNPYPLVGKSFIAKCVRSPIMAFQKIKKYRNGNNVFASVGMLFAVRKNFVLKNPIPEGVFANDQYLYLKCTQIGGKFVYLERAKDYFHTASNLADHLRQSTRHNASKFNMYKHFDKSFVDKAFYLPKWFYFKVLISELLRHPLHSICIYLINIYTKYKARKYGQEGHVSWQSIRTQ